MKLYQKPSIIGLSLIILFLTCAGVLSQSVLHAPSEHQTLTQRLDWARSTVKTDSSFGNGYWIGYTIEKYMHENSRMGWFDSRNKDIPTLQEILSGITRVDSEVVRERRMLSAAQKELQSASPEKKERRKVLKKVAILFRYPSSEAGMTDFDEVKMSTLDSLMDLKDRPLLWLGTAEDAQSIPFLDKLYEDSQRNKSKRSLMAAVAMHETKSLVIPCLRKYVKEGDVELRCQAVFWLAQQEDREAFDILNDVVWNDESKKVREEAVFWIGQKASEKAKASLEKIAFDVEQTELQKQAVFAISQWPKEESVPALSKISRDHPNPEVRKQAIFWLGQTGDPRAVDPLAEIIKMSN